MSEPIKLFGLQGEEVIMYSPKVAEDRVKAGLLFHEPPPAKKTVTKRQSRKETSAKE